MTNKYDPIVSLITGASESEYCGIADYCGILQQGLTRQGVQARIIVLKQTRIRSLLAARQRLALRERRGILHLQYPLAWENGLSLYVLPYIQREPMGVTFHEFSECRIARKWSFLTFALRAKFLIFTTEEERDHFIRLFSWSSPKCHVIPIGSNIPFAQCEPEPGRRVIATFGQLRPNKGIEDFIELARLARQAAMPYCFRIVGALNPWQSEYATRLLMENKDLPNLEWHLDRSADEVSGLLSRAHAAYLPFPDGASQRRGSLLAVLGSGLPTVTTKRAGLPPALQAALEFATTPQEALTKMTEIFARPDRADSLSTAGKHYAQQFTWARISEAHARLYRSLT